jgi:hypothetical protein
MYTQFDVLCRSCFISKKTIQIFSVRLLINSTSRFNDGSDTSILFLLFDNGTQRQLVCKQEDVANYSVLVYSQPIRNLTFILKGA